MARAFTIHTAVSAAPEEKDEVARRSRGTADNAASTSDVQWKLGRKVVKWSTDPQTKGADVPSSSTVEPGGNRKQRRAQWAKARKGTV